MDELRNPFAPGAGAPPPFLVGREEILKSATVTLARIRDKRPAKSFMLIGLRGVGKTVLLNSIENVASEQSYKTISIEITENKRLPDLIIPPLRQLLFALDRIENLSDKVKRAFRVLKSFTSTIKAIKVGQFELNLDVDPEKGSADSGDLEADLSVLFVAVAEAAAARNMPVALFMDEMQYLTENELSALIMAMHRIAQEQLPLVLIGAGLPQLVGRMGKSKSYAERLFNFPKIGNLEDKDARDALIKPVQRAHVTFAKAALDELIHITRGYPYFLQEWGYHTWNVAEQSPITLQVVHVAQPIVIQKLDESFFRVRFDRLTPREKEYLRAMAELGSGPYRSGEIADVLGAKVESIAPLRNGLIKKGMIFSHAHGDTAFTVPLFDEFMKRIMPTFERSS